MRRIVTCHLINFPAATNLLMQCSPDWKLQHWVINGVIVCHCFPTHILNYTISGACTLQRPVLFLKLTLALTHILVLRQIPINERRTVVLYLHLYMWPRYWPQCNNTSVLQERIFQYSYFACQNYCGTFIGYLDTSKILLGFS